MLAFSHSFLRHVLLDEHDVAVVACVTNELSMSSFRFLKNRMCNMYTGMAKIQPINRCPPALKISKRAQIAP